MNLAPYDAILVQSFGGPRRPEDVVPFLRNVTGGRGIPDERLEEVGEHYYGFGGKSPINEHNAALVEAIDAELERRGVTGMPIGIGNRNWTPYGDEVLREFAKAGANRVLMITTSAYGSNSSCRQYREDLGRYVPALRAEGFDLTVDKVRPYFQAPGFVAANVDAVVTAMRAGTREDGDGLPRLVFVTHSIPTAMEEASGAARPATYDAQHRDVAAIVAAGAASELGLGELGWDLVYCSRSGSPRIPWLEPDVNDFLNAEHEAGRLPAAGVVLAPIGFISDHMEVVYDLDTEAAATCRELDVPMERAGTVGTHPAFIASLVDLVEARAAIARGEDAPVELASNLPAWTDVCPAGCCLLRLGQEDPPLATGGEDSPDTLR